MEGEAQYPPSRAGRYRPRPRELAVFAALVILGLVAWLATSPGIATGPFGMNLSPLNSTDPMLDLFFTPLACGALALLAGFAFPKGFYSWGIALNFHSPLAEALTIYPVEKEGVEWLFSGTRSSVGYVVITAVLLVLTPLFYTALSALATGSRRLSMQIPRR